MHRAKLLLIQRMVKLVTLMGQPLHGQTATYSCDKGYNLFGDSIRTCQVTGVWSGSERTCQCVFLMQHAYMCTLTLVLSIHRQQKAHPLFRLASGSQTKIGSIHIWA